MPLLKSEELNSAEFNVNRQGHHVNTKLLISSSRVTSEAQFSDFFFPKVSYEISFRNSIKI